MSNYKGNVNSTVNQRIKSKFVEREILCCDTYNVEFILHCENLVCDELPFTWEDIENLYPDHTERMQEIDREIVDLEDEEPVEPSPWDYETDKEFYAACDEYEKASEEISDKIFRLQLEYEELNDKEQSPQEIYEWWRVSYYLYDKLRDYGEPVLEGPNGYYWGRCCTGQAILLDWVISEICADNEILEGQEYDWSKRTQL